MKVFYFFFSIFPLFRGAQYAFDVMYLQDRNLPVDDVDGAVGVGVVGCGDAFPAELKESKVTFCFVPLSQVLKVNKRFSKYCQLSRTSKEITLLVRFSMGLNNYLFEMSLRTFTERGRLGSNYCTCNEILFFFEFVARSAWRLGRNRVWFE